MFKTGKQTIGIALGGGGTRGAAHIGVLQALHRGGIRCDRIVGTSAGAVVGAMYAATMDPEWIEQRKSANYSREFFELRHYRSLR